MEESVVVTILIGNSDNTLSQSRWADFCAELPQLCRDFGGIVHFYGGSSFSAPQQNCCLVLQIRQQQLPLLRARLVDLSGQFRQEAIVYIAGDLLFAGS